MSQAAHVPPIRRPCTRPEVECVLESVPPVSPSGHTRENQHVVGASPVPLRTGQRCHLATPPWARRPTVRRGPDLADRAQGRMTL